MFYAKPQCGDGVGDSADLGACGDDVGVVFGDGRRAGSAGGASLSDDDDAGGFISAAGLTGGGLMSDGGLQAGGGLSSTNDTRADSASFGCCCW